MLPMREPSTAWRPVADRRLRSADLALSGPRSTANARLPRCIAGRAGRLRPGGWLRDADRPDVVVKAAAARCEARRAEVQVGGHDVRAPGAVKARPERCL